MFITGLRVKYTIKINQERDQLLSNYSILTKTIELLQRNYNILIQERDQLLKDISIFTQEIELLEESSTYI